VPLTADAILRAFDALSEELLRRSECAQIAIAGGAALVLLFNARESTKDVDAYIVSPTAAVVRDAVAEVAAALELPRDWLNDAAKGYFVGLSLGAPLFDSPSLTIRAVTTAQLLAMKLAAWCDAVDRADAQLLLTSIEGRASRSGTSFTRSFPLTTCRKRRTLSTTYGRRSMDLRDLVGSVLSGDLLSARQWVADARRDHLDWESIAFPEEMDQRSLSVTAALLELLAGRAGKNPPPWTNDVGAVDDVVVLDPGLEKMRRSFSYAKEHGPASLLNRNLIALPDFLDVV
jgi:hypothetical protein